MKKTKILHIAPAYQVRGGGIFEVVENLSSVQVHDKLTLVDILCLETNSSKRYFNKTIYNLLPSKVIHFRQIHMTFKFLWANFRAYDAIHIHGAWSFQFVFFTPFLFFFSSKIFYQPHGLIGTTKNRRSSYIKKVAWIIYQKFYLKWCKNIICNSIYEKSELLPYCRYPDKIKIIPNGIEKGFFTKPIIETPRKEKFLFISQVIPVKNLESVFKAIALLKFNDSLFIDIDIYGYGPEHYIAELKDLALKLSITDNVDFKGAVARDDRIAIYDSYKYFILPSLNESFGIAVLEALSRKCKVFVSNNTPWTEYEHKNLFLMDSDEKSIYSCVKNYLLDNRYQAPVGNKINLSLSDFDWNEISSQLSSLYFNKKSID